MCSPVEYIGICFDNHKLINVTKFIPPIVELLCRCNMCKNITSNQKQKLTIHIRELCYNRLEHTCTDDEFNYLIQKTPDVYNINSEEPPKFKFFRMSSNLHVLEYEI